MSHTQSRPSSAATIPEHERILSQILASDDPETLIGGSRELVLIRDLAGRVLRMSPEWSALFGFSTPTLQGTPLLSLIHPQDVWATHDVMDRVNFTKMVSGYVNRYRGLDGIYRPLVWTARMFQDRVVGVAHELPAR